ncbi:hypothetical protein N658DRAFT_488507 [Parathielavia hyrcaniae]|uniref:Uncharacterized protein n=1 Tax=Parathielavia hyrcaniae TaxID=113614 RepID=A0AAN6PZN5_9PEZI|nr:hypothetical protein N658DRAFT_488507 [Parathielavia hyrcaniae]
MAALHSGLPFPTLPDGQCLEPGFPQSKVVVEPASSHDGSPTFAAYYVPLYALEAVPDSEDGYRNSPPAEETEIYRPKFGLRIYDTTSHATAERAALLARRIPPLA